MTTPGKTLGDWNFACRSRTLVDSAFAGSHDFASFFSAPLSLLASGEARASTATQNTTTAHLVHRPQGMPAILRAALMGLPKPCRSDSSHLTLRLTAPLGNGNARLRHCGRTGGYRRIVRRRRVAGSGDQRHQ